MPINFACPHCGKQTTVADQYAGQSGPCAACGKNVTVPFSAGSGYSGPATQSSGGAGAGTALAILAVVLIGGVLVCGGIVVAITLPAISTARTSAQSMTSSNNLKQIGLAVHTYHDAYGQLPPAVVKDAEGKPLYSGFVLLLPFMEQDQLYQQFDKSKAWNDSANMAISSRMLPFFANPASTNTTPGHCDYMLVGGPNAVLADSGQPSSLANVLDGTSNTIMAVEVNSSMAPQSWAEPVAWDPTKPFDSPNPTVVQVLFADGSVRAISKTIPVQTLRLIADRQDGQAVNLP